MNLWAFVTYDEDIAGVKLPCMVTYHIDAGYFLLRGSFFFPRSKEALRHIIEAFSIGPNEKIMNEIVKKKYKGIV